MFNIFRSKKPVTATIEKWQKQYGEVALFKVGDKKIYVRRPTEQEVENIIQSIERSGQKLKPQKVFKKVLELCWLGG